MAFWLAQKNYTTPGDFNYNRAYGYLVPFYNDDAGYFGKIVRVDLDNFAHVQNSCEDYPNSNLYSTALQNVTCFGEGDDALISVLDLTEHDKDLRGFMGGFEGNMGWIGRERERKK